MDAMARQLRLALAAGLLLGFAGQPAGLHAHAFPAAPDCEIGSHHGAGHLGSSADPAGHHPVGCQLCRLSKPRVASALNRVALGPARLVSALALPAPPSARSLAPTLESDAPRAPPLLPALH